MSVSHTHYHLTHPYLFDDADIIKKRGMCTSYTPTNFRIFHSHKRVWRKRESIVWWRLSWVSEGKKKPKLFGGRRQAISLWVRDVWRKGVRVVFFLNARKNKFFCILFFWIAHGEKNFNISVHNVNQNKNYVNYVWKGELWKI